MFTFWHFGIHLSHHKKIKKEFKWLSFQRFKRFWIRSESFIAFIDLLELWIREIFKRLFLFKWWNKKKFIENRSLWRQEQEIDFCNVCRVLKKGWGYQSYKWFKCYPFHFRQYHQSWQKLRGNILWLSWFNVRNFYLIQSFQSITTDPQP